MKPTDGQLAAFNEQGATRAMLLAKRERRGTHKQRCKKCGLRIRRAGHHEGAEHNRSRA